MTRTQTSTPSFPKKTLAVAALGLAATAAAAGSASAASLTPDAVAGLGPLSAATNMVPGAANSLSGVQNAVSNGTSALPANPSSLLPTDNHISGNQVAPVTGLLGGLPVGSSVLGG
jgi:hypothetical protein